MAEVIVDNKIRQVKISEQEYWQYKIGMDVILVTYTTKGGIGRTIYYEYSIKIPN